MAVEAAVGAPARQQLIRSLNEQLLLDYIRGAGKISRPDLARMSRLSKPLFVRDAWIARDPDARPGVNPE